jgi:hypothetical protein
MLLVLGTVTLISCSFVSLDPQARDVIVSTDTNSLKSCKFINTTTVSLWSKADTFQSDKTVATQLDTLARNEAATMGGNVIIPTSEINNAQRAYSVYKCNSQS